jgi:hypothetical protein
MKRSQKDARVVRNTAGVARLDKIKTSARKSSGEQSLELAVSGSNLILVGDRKSRCGDDVNRQLG